jgi:hypothetical protein
LGYSLISIEHNLEEKGGMSMETVTADFGRDAAVLSRASFAVSG